MDTATDGTGGVVIGENDACGPTVLWLEWPPEVHALVCSDKNPNGHINNSDPAMVGLLLCWLLVGVWHKHMGMYWNNSPTILWVERMVPQSSRVVTDLLMALAMQLKIDETPPLTPLHIKRKHNSISDIPPRSFGGTHIWHCKTGAEFLTFFNSNFPPPNQQCW